MNFAAIKTAHKRAAHFGAGIADGPFTPIKSPIGANYCLLLDAGGDSTDDLVLFNSWAVGLNKLADSCLVSADRALCEAFAAFRSRLWLNPERLQ